MLCFECESVAIVINFAFFAFFAFQHITTVELYPWFLSVNKHFSPTDWFIETDCKIHCFFSSFIEYKVVVVAFAEFQLLVIEFNTRTDCFGLTEIKWRICNIA